jgi:hypothetical protein
LNKEETMKTIHQATARSYVVIQLTLIALVLATAPSALAKHRNEKPDDKPVAVLAHLALPGAPAGQMILQEHNGRQYLYVVRNSRKGFTVVDVTKPEEPNVVKRVAWPNGASAGRLQLVGGTVALAEGSSENAEPIPTETVEVLDLSDPTNPRTIQTFTDVTSLVPDEGRNLVYLSNKDGLWILRHQPDQPVIRPCISDDATAIMPSCE